jgi:hypothetical protein
MHTSLQKLNHFVIVCEDNLVHPTDASTTVCLYVFSATKQVSIALLESSHFRVFKPRGCDSCISAKGEVYVFRMPIYARLAAHGCDSCFSEFCRVSCTVFFSNCVLAGISSFQ